MMSEPAWADPAQPTTAAEAQTQLDRIEAEGASLAEQYAASQQALADQQHTLDQVTVDLGEQDRKVAQLSTTISQIVNANRQSDPFSLTVQMITTSSDDNFIDRLATMQSVNAITEEQLARFGSEQQRLNQLREASAAALSSIRTETERQAQLVAQQDEREAAAAALVSRLSAAEQARLQAEQAAREQADAQASTRETATSRSAARAQAAPVTTTPPSGRAGTAVAFALAQVGEAYRMGGTGPGVWDCSGLTMMAYREAGISIPRTAGAQFNAGRAVSKDDLQPGDLVFYYAGIGHVGMYIGNGQIVHAATTRKGVIIAPVFASARPFQGARRYA